MKSYDRCGECLFRTSDGDCHRYPPRVFGYISHEDWPREMYAKQEWPGVKSDEWCGEFVVREGMEDT